MTTAKIQYQNNLRTCSTHLKSNDKIVTDAPIDNHGRGEAFSPTDLLASSLASCMMTLMGIHAQNNGIRFENAEAEMEKIMTDNPRRVAEIKININIEDADLTPEQKHILESAALNCPVAKSLHPEIKQNIKFIYTKNKS